MEEESNGASKEIISLCVGLFHGKPFVFSLAVRSSTQLQDFHRRNDAVWAFWVSSHVPKLLSAYAHIKVLKETTPPAEKVVFLFVFFFTCALWSVGLAGPYPLLLAVRGSLWSENCVCDTFVLLGTDRRAQTLWLTDLATKSCLTFALHCVLP